jgi:hypothetical protein
MNLIPITQRLDKNKLVWASSILTGIATVALNQAPLLPISLAVPLYLNQLDHKRLLQGLGVGVATINETISRSESPLVLPPSTLRYPPRLGLKRKAVHIDVEYVRVTAMRLSWWVTYRAILDFLKEDNSEVEVKVYSTTNPRVQALNAQLRDMGCHVFEQPVILKEGKVSNSNTDALMVDGLISDSPPQKFDTVVIISGDHKFAECARLLGLRGQRSEFIGFDSNTSGEIKSLPECYGLVSYRSIESIPGALSKVQRPEKKSTP